MERLYLEELSERTEQQSTLHEGNWTNPRLQYHERAGLASTAIDRRISEGIHLLRNAAGMSEQAFVSARSNSELPIIENAGANHPLPVSEMVRILKILDVSPADFLIIPFSAIHESNDGSPNPLITLLEDLSHLDDGALADVRSLLRHFPKKQV